jgi:hypothetical protein
MGKREVGEKGRQTIRNTCWTLKGKSAKEDV